MPDISPATVADIPAIATMCDALSAFHGEALTVDPDALARDLLGKTPWGWAFIAKVDDKPVGYAITLRASQMHHGRRGMTIHHLFVAQAWRKHGIGSALIATCEDHARGIGASYINVSTDPDNHGAQTAYLAIGYDRIDPAPRFARKLAP